MDNINNPAFRHVTIEETECRISNIYDKGLSLFIYKTARTDINILNETVGALNWNCEYKDIKGNIYCGVSIYAPDKAEWVTKWDCGEPSSSDNNPKAEASDAFKRACFKWGLGVELYTAPFIWIPASKCNITLEEETVKGKKELKAKCNDRFKIEKIAIENHTITGISIINTSKNNSRVFVWASDKMINKK